MFSLNREYKNSMVSTYQIPVRSTSSRILQQLFKHRASGMQPKTTWVRNPPHGVHVQPLKFAPQRRSSQLVGSQSERRGIDWYDRQRMIPLLAAIWANPKFPNRIIPEPKSKSTDKQAMTQGPIQRPKDDQSLPIEPMPTADRSQHNRQFPDPVGTGPEGVIRRRGVVGREALSIERERLPGIRRDPILQQPTSRRAGTRRFGQWSA
ncbi:hypothetical protein K474DRAFT_609528 [Panus rudis PR-1116 ss-1]|nr:hypothetical protein K474DRAFT_609528 [Panus rudis PR-1116 ss-1]